MYYLIRKNEKPTEYLWYGLCYCVGAFTMTPSQVRKHHVHK